MDKALYIIDKDGHVMGNADLTRCDNAKPYQRFLGKIFRSYKNKRLLAIVGFILVVLGSSLIAIPYFIGCAILGLNKANILMSTVMRKPLNWTDMNIKVGDALLRKHKWIYEDEKQT